MKKIFICLLVCTYVGTLLGQAPQLFTVASPETSGFSPERLQKLEENLTSWVHDPRLNGCVALVIHKGKIVYHKGFGYNDLDKKQAIRPDDIYRIASQTKAITSTAVMMLFEEGKFLLDDPVSRYIPAFSKPMVLKTFNPADTTYTAVPATSEITIRQLLTHTSGIGYAQIGSKESNAIYEKAGIPAGIGIPKGKQLGEVINKLATLPLMHQPGAQFTYGLNTDVLGYLVEVVSGMRLDEFFHRRIFQPLGMQDTYFYVPASKHDRVVSLFEEREGKIKLTPPTIQLHGVFVTDYPKTAGTYFSGGAGLSSTALDYAKFLQLFLNGGTFNGHRLLSRNTIRMMTMNQIGDIDIGKNKFGLGFGITTEKGSAILPTPEGVIDWGGAFATTFWADPQEQLIGIFYRQLWGSTLGDITDKFKVLVYAALE